MPKTSRRVAAFRRKAHLPTMRSPGNTPSEFFHSADPGTRLRDMSESPFGTHIDAMEKPGPYYGKLTSKYNHSCKNIFAAFRRQSQRGWSSPIFSTVGNLSISGFWPSYATVNLAANSLGVRYPSDECGCPSLNSHLHPSSNTLA